METLIKTTCAQQAGDQPAAEAQRPTTWKEDTSDDVAAKAAADAVDVLQFVADHIPADAPWAVEKAHELQAHVIEVHRTRGDPVPIEGVVANGDIILDRARPYHDPVSGQPMERAGAADY